MDRGAFGLFVEVADIGSISLAAALRQTAQSNISRQIADLERACGARLFERTGRGVVLTDFGTRIIPRVRAWLADTDQLLSDIKTSSGTTVGDVRIGIVPSMAHPLITTLHTRLRAAYPDIHLTVRESQLSEVEGWLDAGRVDLGILFESPRAAAADRLMTLASIDTWLIGPPGAPETSGKTVDFRRLKGLPLVLPCRPNRIRDTLDEAARRIGIALNTVLEADSLIVQREIAASGQGFGVLGPYAIAEDVRAGRISAARIVKPDLGRVVTLGTARHGSLSPAAKVVVGLLREIADATGSSATFGLPDTG